jgi:hypothetical protein
MAEIVIGVGTSHSPQLSIRAKDWEHLLKKDETDPRLDYASLLKRAKPGLAAELTAEKFRERDEACLNAVRTLGGVGKCHADIALFSAMNRNSFMIRTCRCLIYHGKSLPVGRQQISAAGWKDAERQGWAETAPEYETAQDSRIT